MKRPYVLLPALAALLLLGGCAIEPTYQYARTSDGGGYYYGQSAYGDADTVVYGDVAVDPWTWNPWWGYYGPGWGWGGVGFGATYTYRAHRHRHHPRRAHGWHPYRQSSSAPHVAAPREHRPPGDKASRDARHPQDPPPGR